jgi:SpoIID/LytB domain protein
VPRRPCAALLAALVPALLLPFRAPAQQAQERLILAPETGTSFLVQVVYPNEGVTCEAKRRRDLRARYRGRLEILRQDDGRLAIIEHVPFDAYLRGISEVPRSWPMEALRAQVVAARSYALYHLEHPSRTGRRLGYDICSTDQCQVYRGLSVEEGPFGDAWVKAVESTRGLVLRYRGQAIQAFYHSTSPGRTKAAFPGGSPLPYLRSVEGFDEDSPLARWSVSVPLADLGPILAAAGRWPGGRIETASLEGASIRLSGSGRSVTLTKAELRSALNAEAACAFPDRYPTPGSTGARLPQTVPSIDFEMSRSGDAILLTGRGWGHGVGMSQYGARHLAAAGWTFERILAHFYAGLRPERVEEPGVIRVLVAEDASLVRVTVEGRATATTSAGGALAPGDQFEVRGGRGLDVRRGIGPSLEPVLRVELATAAPLAATAGGSVTLPYVLSGSAKVTMIVLRGGAEVARTPEVSQTAGPNALTLALAAPLPSPSPVPVATAGTATPTPVALPSPPGPGTYQVILEAFDGLDRVRTPPVTLEVRAAAASPPPRPAPGPWGPLLVAAGGLALVAAVLAMLRARRA